MIYVTIKSYFLVGSCVQTNYTFYVINKIQAVSYQDDESEGEDPASSGEESDFEEDAPKQKKNTKKKAAPKSKGKGKKSTDKNTVSDLLQELEDGSPTVTFDDSKSGGGKLTQLVTGDEYETNDDWRIGGLF